MKKWPLKLWFELFWQLRQRLGRWLYLFIALTMVLVMVCLDKPVVAQQYESDRQPLLYMAQAETAAKETSAKSVNPKPENLKTLPSPQPVLVSVGLHISNLADVNQASEAFDINGYLMYSWRDSRLAFTVNPGEPTSKSAALDQIWHPGLEMVNVKAANGSDLLVDIQSDGTVMVQERFTKTLSSGLELQRFPFDSQSLQVAIESLKYGEKEVQLIADSQKISIGKDSFVSLSEWQIGALRGANGKSFFPPEKQHYSRVTIALEIKRKSGFYVLKVMIPLFLITVASWSVFWIDPDEFSTQIGIAFTNLLTVVALLLVINDSLPKVSYATFMDGFTLICFVTILLAILVLIIAHRSKTKNNDARTYKVLRLARWAVPSLFLISNISLVISLHLLAV